MTSAPPAEAQGGITPRKRVLIARVWREYLSRQWRLILLAAPMILLVGATAGGYVWLTKEAGELLAAGDSRIVYQIPAWIVAISLIRAIAMYLQSVILSDLAHRVLRDLQGAMFQALLTADFARVSGQSVGALVSRFVSDINVISDGIIRTATSLVRDVAVLVAVIVTMLHIDWVLALGVVGMLAIAIGPLQRIAKRARGQTKEAQAQLGALSSVLYESLSGARLVRTYGLETYEAARAGEEFEARRKMAMRLVRNRARSDPILEALGGLAAAAVFAFIGWRVAHGEADIGDLLALVTAIATASAAARSLGTYNTVLNEGLAAAERVFQVIDDAPTIRDRPDARPLTGGVGTLSFENVTFSYGDAAPAITDVSFEVARGETVALVGPSGAGKSTIFNLIPRLFDPLEGRLAIDGTDIRDVTLASLRRQIAIVSQDIVLFNDTVRANIAFGKPNATEAEIIAAAKAAAAHDFVSALEDGYDTLCGERGHRLSGGERQRIALARAFLRDAPILLLDEATSALDAESERKIQEALGRLRAGRATLVIAHRLATVRDATRIIVLEDGKVREIGAHDELIGRDGLYAKLARLQFQAKTEAA